MELPVFPTPCPEHVPPADFARWVADWQRQPAGARELLSMYPPWGFYRDEQGAPACVNAVMLDRNEYVLSTNLYRADKTIDFGVVKKPQDVTPISRDEFYALDVMVQRRKGKSS